MKKFHLFNYDNIVLRETKSEYIGNSTRKKNRREEKELVRNLIERDRQGGQKKKS